METKHTPGPWSYRSREHDDWGIVRAPTNADGYSPIICQARDPYCLDEEDLAPHRAAKTDPWEANARLIAAAPELLAALREARDALHQHYVDWDGEPEDAVPLQLAREKCDAAIRKATPPTIERSE